MQNAVQTITAEQLGSIFCKAVSDHLDGKTVPGVEESEIVTGYIHGMQARFAKSSTSSKYESLIVPAHMPNATVEDLGKKVKRQGTIIFKIDSLIEGMPEKYNGLFDAAAKGKVIGEKIAKTPEFKALLDKFAGQNRVAVIDDFGPKWGGRHSLPGYIELKVSPRLQS